MPLNTYVEQTGDWQVAGAAVFEPAGVCTGEGEFLLLMMMHSADAKEEAAATAAHYYHLAWQYTKPRRGQLILMSGYPVLKSGTVFSPATGSDSHRRCSTETSRWNYSSGTVETTSTRDEPKTYERLLSLESCWQPQGTPSDFRCEVRPAAVAAGGDRSGSVSSTASANHCTAPLVAVFSIKSTW